MAAPLSSHSTEDGDSASKSKLCLKIPNPSFEPNVSVAQSPRARDEDENGKGKGHIVCEFCGKRFTSGKAWGGHKRHHLQMKKKQKLQQSQANSTMKRKKRRPCRTIYATIKDGKPICCVCYRVFPSLNSLFKHKTRFHDHGRDRTVRSTPPRTDLLSDLIGWLKKDKRGRVCGSDVDLVPRAAYNLISLSRWSENTTEEEMEGRFSCAICRKIFPTREALRGHKRCHWTPLVASPSASSSNGNGHFGFDLNMPYVDGDEDTNAHSSS